MTASYACQNGLRKQGIMSDGKQIRVLLAKTSLDGHIRGIAVVGMALRDAGMEVIYTGALAPEQIVASATHEGADVLAINVGGSPSLMHRTLDLLREKGMDDLLIIAGGPLPPDAAADLERRGVARFFPPGSSLQSIVDFVKQRAGS